MLIRKAANLWDVFATATELRPIRSFRTEQGAKDFLAHLQRSSCVSCAHCRREREAREKRDEYHQRVSEERRHASILRDYGIAW